MSAKRWRFDQRQSRARHNTWIRTVQEFLQIRNTITVEVAGAITSQRAKVLHFPRVVHAVTVGIPWRVYRLGHDDRNCAEERHVISEWRIGGCIRVVINFRSNSRDVRCSPPIIGRINVYGARAVVRAAREVIGVSVNTVVIDQGFRVFCGLPDTVHIDANTIRGNGVAVFYCWIGLHIDINATESIPNCIPSD